MRLPAGEYAANQALIDAADRERRDQLQRAIAGKRSFEQVSVALLDLIARET
jgi:hypothetical protein